MLVALFYFLLDGRRIGQYVQRFVPAERRQHVREVAGEIHVVLGQQLFRLARRASE